MDYLYLALFVVGAIATYFAIRFYADTQKLLQTGITTDATVIDLIPSRSSKGTTYKPEFAYSDISGNKQTFVSSIASKPSPYAINDIVRILYDPNSHEEPKTVGFWGLYRWTVILLSIAAPFLIIGGGYFLFKMGHAALLRAF